MLLFVFHWIGICLFSAISFACLFLVGKNVLAEFVCFAVGAKTRFFCALFPFMVFEVIILLLSNVAVCFLFSF